MKIMISILAIVAVVQVGLAVWAFSGKTSLNDQAASSSLLTFDKAQVDRLVISDSEGSIELSKKEGKWLSSDDFPIEAGKVDTMLDKLSDLKFGLPIATSDDALGRFKVAEKDFERHLQLKKSDDTLAQIYVGSGAGARKSHVRNSDQDAVYTAAIGSYDIPASLDDWQDKGILLINSDTVKKIEVNGLTLDMVESSDVDDKTKVWTVTDLEAGKVLDQQAVRDALSPLVNMRWNQILGKSAKPEYGLEKAKLALKLSHEKGERSYLFGKLKDSEDYVLKVTDRPEYFQISSFTAKNIVEKMDKTKWLKDVEPVAKPTSE